MASGGMRPFSKLPATSAPQGASSSLLNELSSDGFRSSSIHSRYNVVSGGGNMMNNILGNSLSRSAVAPSSIQPSTQQQLKDPKGLGGANGTTITNSLPTTQQGMGMGVSSVGATASGIGSTINNNGTANRHSFSILHNNNNNNIVRKVARNEDSDDDEDEDEEQFGERMRSLTSKAKQLPANWFLERSRHIPLRLNGIERNLLRLLEAALHVSEYTDKVDVAIGSSARAKRVNEQLRHICAILCGLLVATDFKRGQQLVESKEFVENEAFFQKVFEIGRRHKIMNPAKMRGEYGKMIHLLQDSGQNDVIAALNGLDLWAPLKTVHSVLDSFGGLALLEDPLMFHATLEILPEGKDRYQIQREIKTKEAAIKMLCKKYATATLHRDDIEQCIYSIGDNHTFLRENRDSVKKMLRLLKTYFDPKKEDSQFSLAITPGQAGARLHHTHDRQFMYVYQSLTLWKKILHDMFRLWYEAELDLLRGNPYKLSNTGQGLNRIQSSPKISGSMQKIIRSAQSKVTSWIGSSVVHLGDHNVPNALIFIDKYTQISRILNPIVITLEYIPKIKDDKINQYIISAFGSHKQLIKFILSDFFKHAFDGSGADNFFDAGSCIDGRLTSAWNWCSKIEKKPYYPVFLLAGFNGFDGSFN
eukprot:gene16303-19390_t